MTGEVSVLQLDILEHLDGLLALDLEPPTARDLASAIWAEHGHVLRGLRILAERGLVESVGRAARVPGVPGPAARLWRSKSPPTLRGQVCTLLRRARVDSGLTRGELARQLKVSARSVRRAEACDTLPRFADEWAAFHGLQVRVDLVEQPTRAAAK